MIEGKGEVRRKSRFIAVSAQMSRTPINRKLLVVRLVRGRGTRYSTSIKT